MLARKICIGAIHAHPWTIHLPPLRWESKDGTLFCADVEVSPIITIFGIDTWHDYFHLKELEFESFHASPSCSTGEDFSSINSSPNIRAWLLYLILPQVLQPHKNLSSRCEMSTVFIAKLRSSFCHTSISQKECQLLTSARKYSTWLKLIRFLSHDSLFVTHWLQCTALRSIRLMTYVFGLVWTLCTFPIL